MLKYPIHFYYSDASAELTGVLALPGAVAILALTGQIPVNGLDGCLFVGELALDGGHLLGSRPRSAYQLLAPRAGVGLHRRCHRWACVYSGNGRMAPRRPRAP